MERKRDLFMVTQPGNDRIEMQTESTFKSHDFSTEDGGGGAVPATVPGGRGGSPLERRGPRGCSDHTHRFRMIGVHS